MQTNKPYIALLGGSFNPPHIGHFRIALETHEALQPKKTLLIPCADPPHKTGHNLLPFDLRVSMLESVTSELPELEVCTIEAERNGPSYTIDTLIALHNRYPQDRLLFILGSDNFPLLPSWNKGLDLPVWADIVVVPRTTLKSSRDAQIKEFCDITCGLWPEAQAIDTPYPAVKKAFSLTGHFPEKVFTNIFTDTTNIVSVKIPDLKQKETCINKTDRALILYLDQPFLDISSSLIRQRHKQKRRLDFLVPDKILNILSVHTRAINKLWHDE